MNRSLVRFEYETSPLHTITVELFMVELVQGKHILLDNT